MNSAEVVQNLRKIWLYSHIGEHNVNDVILPRITKNYGERSEFLKRPPRPINQSNYQNHGIFEEI